MKIHSILISWWKSIQIFLNLDTFLKKYPIYYKFGQIKKNLSVDNIGLTDSYIIKTEICAARKISLI